MIAGYSFKHYAKSELRSRLFQLQLQLKSECRIENGEHLIMSKISVFFHLSLDHFQAEVLYKIQLWI